MELLHMINALAEAKGKNSKIETLRSFPEEHAAGLKVVVAAALDPMRTYHVSKIEKVELNPLFHDMSTHAHPRDFLMFIHSLMLKGSASANDKLKLGEIVAKLDENDQQVAELIIRRDLRCGMGLASFREVWGEDFLPPFKYALMAEYSRKKILENITFDRGAYSQLKSDGKRCIITKRGNNIAGRSRNGKTIDCLHYILPEAAKILTCGRDFDLDGELVMLDENGDIMPRSVGNGIIARKVLTLNELSRIRFIVWDLVVFEDGEPISTPYRDRLAFLQIHLINLDTDLIRATEYRIVYSLREAQQHYKELVGRGEEGIILKDRDSVWTPGDKGSCREANGFKFKEEFEGDFRITSWYKGSPGTKYENVIGGLTCESQCGKIKFNVGSGLKDKDRLMDDPDSLINTIVEVKYNGRIMAQGSETWSLFLPRVVEFRDDDKDVADNLEKIVANEEATRELGIL